MQVERRETKKREVEHEPWEEHVEYVYIFEYYNSVSIA